MIFPEAMNQLDQYVKFSTALKSATGKHVPILLTSPRIWANATLQL